jgi:hypothetical protein
MTIIATEKGLYIVEHDLQREQLQGIARLALMLASTAIHKIPLIELREVLKVEGVNVSDLIRAGNDESKSMPLMSRLAIREIQRRLVADT